MKRPEIFLPYRIFLPETLAWLMQELTQIVFVILFILITVPGNGLHAQEELCSFVGELTLPVATSTSFATCLATGNAPACEIGYIILACEEDPSCSGVVGRLSEMGCTYVVKKVGEVYEITGDCACQQP
ncbi:MAG: hypothetical protein IPJ40_07720 [Saprospirales bacterium]|nr:hypothetical protein [Saprospirales bacterium]